MRIALLMLVLVLGCSEEKEVSPVSEPSPQATPEVNNDDDDTEKLVFTEGRQYATDDIDAGKLTLHNCPQGQLYSVSSDGNPVLANPSLTVGSKRPDIFVVYATDDCEMHLDGKRIAPVQVSDDKKNLAKVVSSVEEHNGVVAARIGENLTITDKARLYVSNNAGSNWHRIATINPDEINSHPDAVWNGDIFTDNRSMFMSARNDGTHWWHSTHAPYQLHGDYTGFRRNYGIAVTGIGKGAGNAAVQIVQDCGMFIFTKNDGETIEDNEIVELSKDSAVKVKHTVDEDNNTSIHISLAGTPSSMDCRPALRINGYEFTAAITSDFETFPATPAVVATTENGKIKISTPETPANSSGGIFAPLGELYYYGNKDNATQWHTIWPPSWKQDYSTEASTVGTKNRMLFLAAYREDRSPYKDLWFYIESDAQ